MVEFVRAREDIVAAHQRVAGMNFIPGGYKMLAGIREARAEAKSQLLASGEGDIETEPPSPTYGVDFETLRTSHSHPYLQRRKSLHYLHLRTSRRYRSMRTALPHLERMISFPHVQILFGM